MIPPASQSEIHPGMFEYICRLVMDRSGICLGADKHYLVQLRLAPLARLAGFTSVNEYAARLKQTASGPQHTAVIEAMTTNETSFFRDVAPFDALAQHILPKLARDRGPSSRIRIWCAACSTGQEPYSIAMMIHQKLPQLADRVEILATDLANSVLAVAKNGRFSQLEVNRGLPAPMLLRYFKQEGNEWQISDQIRRMVNFRAMNLVEAWGPMPSFDVILLRNVMIYFNTETKRGIFRRVRQALQPDGVLFLGAAETTIGLDDAFCRNTVGRAVCYSQRPLEFNTPAAANAPAMTSPRVPTRTPAVLC